MRWLCSIPQCSRGEDCTATLRAQLTSSSRLLSWQKSLLHLNTSPLTSCCTHHTPSSSGGVDDGIKSTTWFATRPVRAINLSTLPVKQLRRCSIELSAIAERLVDFKLKLHVHTSEETARPVPPDCAISLPTALAIHPSTRRGDQCHWTTLSGSDHSSWAGRSSPSRCVIFQRFSEVLML